MSKEAKSYESVKVYEGVYVYLDKSSPYWKLRVHDPVTSCVIPDLIYLVYIKDIQLSLSA